MKNLISKIIYILIGFIQLYSYAQISIGTPTPHKSADIHLASKNKTLILNHVNDKNAISNPHNGMVFYDTNEKCFRGIVDGEYTKCFESAVNNPKVYVLHNELIGDFECNENLTNVFYLVELRNETFESVNLITQTTDLLINDNNVHVESVSLNMFDENSSNLTIDIPSGESTIIYYKLNGSFQLDEIAFIWQNGVLSSNFNFNCFIQ